MFGSILPPSDCAWCILLEQQGKLRSLVIKVIAMISNHLLGHTQGALARLSEPSSFYLANLCGGNKQKMVCVVLAMHCVEEKGKRKAQVIMGKVGITHTSLLGRKEPYRRLSFLFNFIISCHLLISSLLTQLFHCLSPTETLPPWLVAEGWGESRKPNQGNRYDRCNLRYQIS